MHGMVLFHATSKMAKFDLLSVFLCFTYIGCSLFLFI